MTVEIIAEVGVNHQGEMARAARMIGQIAASGAAVAKFQSFTAAALARSDTPKARYQRQGDSEESHLQMLASLELTRENQEDLFLMCQGLGLEFMSTPYGIPNAMFLHEIGVPRFKTASADIVDIPLHRCLAATGKPVLIATGMASDQEIERALSCYGVDRSRITLMHAVSMYPTPFVLANLERIRTLKKMFGVRVGFSDHTMGKDAAQMAVALGAAVIEKHVTENVDLPGPDHSASLMLDELPGFVDSLRQAEEALGDGHPIRTPDEEEFAVVSRKSPYLARPLEIGQRLTELHICLQRPGTGETYASLESSVGKSALRSMPIGTPLYPADFQGRSNV